jgi:hypothetical protein
VLVPQKLGLHIDHLCLLSSVSVKYGNGKPLLSVSVVGKNEVPIEQIILEVNKLAQMDLGLELIQSVKVPKALPRFHSENKETSQGFLEKEGVLYCGDHCTSPSINGALRSGRLAAEFILQGVKSAVSK